MAMQAGRGATPLSPMVVGNAFIQQYYRILHGSPDEAYKFYKDTSIVGRTGSDGVMEYVTTLPEINKILMSMDFSKCLAEIKTADAVLSHNNGVLIVVTGSLTMPEGVCRGFTQSFFLAPQLYGYFVLNDTLRFIPERPPVVINQVVNQENESNQHDRSVAESDPTPVAVAEHLNTDHVVVENNDADWEVLNPTVDVITVENNTTANGTTAVEPPVQVTEEDPKMNPVAAFPPPPTQKDVTNKSHASIVSSLFSRVRHVVGL